MFLLLVKQPVRFPVGLNKYQSLTSLVQVCDVRLGVVCLLHAGGMLHRTRIEPGLRRGVFEFLFPSAPEEKQKLKLGRVLDHKRGRCLVSGWCLFACLESG